MDYMNRIRLRCYMRGLGIGIVVTALILGLALENRGTAMSDAEIKERARELGMVESTVLSQMPSQQKQEDQAESGDTPKDSHVPESSPEEDHVPEDGDMPGNSGSPEDGDMPGNSGSPEDGDIPGNSGSPEDGTVPEDDTQRETVLFTITRGESSVAVSQALAEAGLVEDARAYDRYLCDNGYATRIVAETHRIPVGATEEEIAQIITKK